jgi:multiple sugar transport system substrate-binding protein
MVHVRKSLVALAAITVALTGCSAQEETPKAQSATTPATIDFWSWADMSKPVAAWNRQHPELRVNYQNISSDFFQKLQAAVTAGTGAPDVVQVDYNNLPSSVVSGLLQKITDKTGGIKDKFAKPVWDQVNIAGEVYGVPQDIGPQVLYYREDLFKKYKIDVPKTWDEYQAAAERLKAADPKAYITSFPTNGGVWLASLAWNAGAQWFQTGTSAWKVAIDDPATLKVADYWQGMVDKKLVKGDTHWQPTWFNGLANGTYATWIGPSWGAEAIRTNAPKLSGKWRIAPLPQWAANSPNTVFWGGSLTSVTSASKKVDASVTFIDWLNTSTDSATILAESLFPASIEGQKSAALTQPDKYFGGQKLVDYFSTSNASSSAWTWGPVMTDTTNELADGIQTFLNGKSTLKEALTKVQGETVNTLKTKGISVQ